MPVTLRDAKESDAATIRRIVRAANINPTGLDWPRFIVAEDGGAIVGVGQVKPHRDGTRELSSIAVVPARQGQGIGTTIINELLTREHGTLHLTCRSRLQGYYEHFGFRRLEPRHYPPYFARVLPILNTVGRVMGFQIIVMRRDV
ncbi:MAG TPA: GNAT family N-acetyltransferase [Candidatus Dormibacteraeota bacterium]|nr:GNAT family N-acetyltransferase [Candidatus Dormibacteraeota bacterium]